VSDQINISLAIKEDYQPAPTAKPPKAQIAKAADAEKPHEEGEKTEEDLKFERALLNIKEAEETNEEHDDDNQSNDSLELTQGQEEAKEAISMQNNSLFISR